MYFISIFVITQVYSPCMQACNAGATSSAQKIQYFKILDLDFSVPGGELGPTLKLVRPKVMVKHHDLIESMY